jgi:hypothetical protein
MTLMGPIDLATAADPPRNSNVRHLNLVFFMLFREASVGPASEFYSMPRCDNQHGMS